MNILFCIPRLEIGGAEVFLIRLVSYLKSQGHHCVILETTEYANPVTGLKSQLSDDIPVYNLTGSKFFYKVIDKLDKETKSTKFRALVLKKILQKIIRKHKIDVINTHVFSADYWISQALKKHKTPIAITMHGCYEAPHINKIKASDTLKRANGIIYIAEKNLKFIKENDLKLTKTVISKIYNGYLQHIDSVDKVSRLSVNCNEDDFVFVMVARGIPQKGWEIAVNAFTTLNNQYSKTKLLFVGGGEYLDRLKEKNVNSNIMFLGPSNKPQVYMEISNVGILPTYYPNESLPNSITEYLYNHLPVISSNLGDIKQMVSVDDKTAGIIIETITDETLLEAMKTYLLDSSLYESHKLLSKEAIRKFDFDNCAQAYLKLFTEISLKQTAN